jgi:hypothetical protein
MEFKNESFKISNEYLLKLTTTRRQELCESDDRQMLIVNQRKRTAIKPSPIALSSTDGI